jgi:hypothetical protein
VRLAVVVVVVAFVVVVVAAAAVVTIVGAVGAVLVGIIDGCLCARGWCL